MLEEMINKYLPFFITILEIMGIIVVLTGSMKAFYHYVFQLFKKTDYPIKFKFANTLATGLEFKLAAEILKTVLVKSLDELIIIAAVSLLRGFMSFIIYWEMKNESRNE
ncbi:DUF1622 domain-containing protein [uncultured Clostridium sp.]|uniref:DUF1622 domain-containing protein n=1 Tax=uncultured Clostridium sp. TaxID=59620 RepID=UPI0025E9A372|nr:DUF1622 domain-containing protein [uncultured Clostridium sp.]